MPCYAFYLTRIRKGDQRLGETKGTTHNKTIQILAFADHIVLLERTTGVLKEAFTNLCKATKETGLNQSGKILNTCKKVKLSL
jgi:hypothetical protein